LAVFASTRTQRAKGGDDKHGEIKTDATGIGRAGTGHDAHRTRCVPHVSPQSASWASSTNLLKYETKGMLEGKADVTVFGIK